MNTYFIRMIILILLYNMDINYIKYTAIQNYKNYIIILKVQLIY